MTDKNLKELILSAIACREKAYAPYSNFKVGAALLTKDNKIYCGCNVENASYGATNCAERTAIFKAVSEGYTYIKALAIVVDMENYIFPCGICRQVIQEFSDKDTIILIAKNENDYIIKSLEDILPQSFSKNDLIK